MIVSFSSPPPSVPSPFPHGIHSWVKNGEAGTFKGLCKVHNYGEIRSDTMIQNGQEGKQLLCNPMCPLSELGFSWSSHMEAHAKQHHGTTDVEPAPFPFSFCFHCMPRCFADDEILPRIAATSQFLSYSSLTTVSACHWSRQNGPCAAIGRHKIILLSYWSTQNSLVLPLVGKCLEDSQVSE